MDRISILRDLISLNKTSEVLADQLSELDWDYGGEPLVVMPTQIRDVLGRFIAGNITSQELEAWANLMECREDLEFEEKKHDEIANIIYSLANPELEGKITAASCKALMASLD